MVRRRPKEKVIGRRVAKSWRQWLRAGDSGSGRLEPEESIGYLSKKWSQYHREWYGPGFTIRVGRMWYLLERPDLRPGQEPGTILQKDW